MAADTPSRRISEQARFIFRRQRFSDNPSVSNQRYLPRKTGFKDQLRLLYRFFFKRLLQRNLRLRLSWCQATRDSLIKVCVISRNLSSLCVVIRKYVLKVRHSWTYWTLDTDTNQNSILHWVIFLISTVCTLQRETDSLLWNLKPAHLFFSMQNIKHLVIRWSSLPTSLRLNWRLISSEQIIQVGNVNVEQHLLTLL